MTSKGKRENSVSIVVQCRNERDHIETVLRSILNQDEPPGSFEIIVADGIADVTICCALLERENPPLTAMLKLGAEGA